MENVADSDSIEIEENENVLITHARSTFAHARNDSGFDFHSVVAVGISFSDNVRETAAKLLLVDASMFAACKNRLLMHDSCKFLIFYDLHQTPQ